MYCCLLTQITTFQRSSPSLDMESIDALAKAVNEYSGGLVLVSHDMRLISQVANEIWICDKKKITKYKGDIVSMR
jgi:ATP-binding cassette subfamily F protein 2